MPCVLLLCLGNKAEVEGRTKGRVALKSRIFNRHWLVRDPDMPTQEVGVLCVHIGSVHEHQRFWTGFPAISIPLVKSQLNPLSDNSVGVSMGADCNRFSLSLCVTWRASESQHSSY